MGGERRKARSLVLRALYECDAIGHDPEAALAGLLELEALSEANAAFARDLVSGVMSNLKIIDVKIREFAPAWPLDQLSCIDRNILRLAIFEILLDNKVPVKAAINEAVELAKAFGSESSSRFINGVLGSVSALASR
ncbi:MAG: transcription antitermination factor NusB [Dehalococcoidia bacterium]|jgi:N utilization substance protein B|nr:MAG: transcription antitermination factor NusB [Dehalococcoidia bacterium]